MTQTPFPSPGPDEPLAKAQALCDAGRLREAADIYRTLAGTHRRQKFVLNRLGDVLLNLKEFEQAIKSYDRVLAIDPGLADAHYGRAVALTHLKRPRKALASYDSAIAAAPGHANAHCHRAMVLRKMGRLAEALEGYDKAIGLNADHVEAHLNRGVLLGECRRAAEGLASFDRAIALRPDHADARMLKAELLLLAGEYPEGWDLYEWRWRSRFRTLVPALASIPAWDGAQPIAGKTILVHPEVGYGDLLMFSRYASLIRERGATPVIMAPEPLLELLAGLDGAPRVVRADGPPPPADFRCPIMSLPRAFATTLQTVPGRTPYLKADPAKLEAWRSKLGPRQVPRIGLVWGSNEKRGIDAIAHRNRSVPLSALEYLRGLPAEFHSLQKELSAADAEALGKSHWLADHSSQLADFSDTAALAQEMELVISIDTSVAHLAGALGRPLWVLLPYASDYRWTMDAARTAWYPDAVLFRQSSPAGWDEVVDKVRRELLAFLNVK